MSMVIAVDPTPLRADESGAIRVGKSRVLLELVVHAYQQGYCPEEIVARYDTLDVADVYSAVGYYLRHRSEVDAYLACRHRQADDLRQTIEARFPPDGLRARLLARREPSSVNAAC